MTEDLNVNLAKCLKESTDFGVNHIHNICTGSVVDVPWGSVDWLLCIGLIGFLGGMAMLFGGMMYSVISDF
jgi:hypothetical protein